MDLSFLRTNYDSLERQLIPFQSLFLWIFRSYMTTTIETTNAMTAFQSLFLWIFRSYKKFINIG